MPDHQNNELKANVTYWAKMPRWSEDEAAALLINLNPEALLRICNYDPHMSRILPWRIGTSEAMALRDRAKGMRGLTHRAFEAQEIEFPATPARWLRWAARLDLKVSTELAAAVERYDGEDGPTFRSEKLAERRLEVLQSPAGTLSPADKPKSDVSTRERESMLRLIIGMAMAGYRYDPKAGRNTAISDIVGDLEKLGLALSDETVRRYLREAIDYLPRD